MSRRMLPLRCTVRRCHLPLALAGRTLRCGAGHSFDRAREGYWNLLQPQDRRSPRPGDRDAALEARSRWLARGLADGLIATVGTLLDRIDLPQGAAVADLGSGEGTFTGRLLDGRSVRACGVDLSVRAARRAARAFPDIGWVVANADRELPFPDGSLDLVLSVFGRRPGAEIHRALRDPGRLVVVLPAEDDLIELREAVQGRGDLRTRAAAAVEELGAWFEPAERATWREHVRLDRDGLEDALALSYRGARRAERERLAGIDELVVTLAADLLSFDRRAASR